MRSILLSSLLLLTTCCFAQQADMTLFFKSPSAELTARRPLLDSIHQFERQSPWTLANLRSRLDHYENLERSLQRHYQYFRLLVERNRKDTTAKAARDEYSQALDIFSANADSALQIPIFSHLTPAAIKAYRLSPYTYLLSQQNEEARHSLSPAAEQISTTVGERSIDRLADRYDDLIDSIRPGKTKAATLAAYARHGELFAATLIDITRLKQALAVSHHYKGAPQQYYQHRLQLSEDSVKSIFKKAAAAAHFLQEHQQLPAPPTYRWQPLPFAGTRALVNSALVPLGPDYQARFAHLLDPANGLLDIGPGTNRAGGGNSFGTNGTPIGLYMQAFDGGFQNISTLIHEGGHAMHRQLMSEHGIIPSYASGPNFLSEAYAMLNELLLLDELEKRAKSPEEKAWFTRLFSDKLIREIFTSAEEGAFEQQLYEGVAAGHINGLKDINALYTNTMRTYEPAFPAERENEWIAKRLIFEDPLYNANYLFAILVTCKLYQMHTTDPGFAAKYQALLSAGFSAPAAASIKNYMGFNLEYSGLFSNALDLLQKKHSN